MNTEFILAPKRAQVKLDRPRRAMAPPRWDALVAQSRPWLPCLFRAVLSEVIDGFRQRGLTVTDRLQRLLGALLKAYTIGVFNSDEIEADGVAESAEPCALSSAELRQFRRAHPEVLTHCLARVYCLAWQMISPGAQTRSAASNFAQTAQEYWWHALAEARKRLEWAAFADVTDQN